MDFFASQPAASASASASGVMPRGESNNHPGKIRSACNRCHSQKLRCVKDIGQDSCMRCIRLKTSCGFSRRAPRASLKHRGQVMGPASDDYHEPLLPLAAIHNSMPNVDSNSLNDGVYDSDWFVSASVEADIAEGRATIDPHLSNPMLGNSRNMQDMCWPGFLHELRDINSESTRSWARSPLPLSNPHMRIEDQNTNDDVGTCPTPAARKLAKLNVALCECATNLPSMTKEGASFPGVASNGLGDLRKQTIFVIDDLFRLTTEFITVMKCLSVVEYETGTALPSVNVEQLGAQSVPSPVAYNQQFSDAGQHITGTGLGPQSMPLSHVDQATMFMVVSCHFRLTEVYVSVFQKIQACVEYSLVPQVGKDWAVVVPQVQIGSLTLPPLKVDIDTPLSSVTSSSSMYILMITMLSSQLWEQLTGVMGVRGGVPTNCPPAYSCAFDTIWDSVMERTDHLSQTITATKHLLQRYAVVAK